MNDVVNAQVYTVAAKDLLKTSFTLNNASPNSIFELSVGVFGSLGSNSLNTIMWAPDQRRLPLAQRAACPATT